jgi:GDP-L-fucose synthase
VGDILRNSRILVTGGAGFLGKKVVELVEQAGPAECVVPRSAEFDLTDRGATDRLFEHARPDVVIHLAAEVGGIGANRANPGRFFYANMSMGLNVLEASRIAGVKNFIALGTVCAYPKLTPIPFKEENLWNGFPEETNAPYGVAKKALLLMLQGYREQYGMKGIGLLPVNLYGPRDNFDPGSSHVIPALIRKCVEAKQSGADHIICWGSGSASREFLYVDDCAEAVVLAASHSDRVDPVNIGSGQEITIRELVEKIAELCEFEGEIRWDASQPDGQPRRCLDTSVAEKEFGFRARTPLDLGLRATIDWWLEQAGG